MNKIYNTFDCEYLHQLFKSAKPFPHVVIDNFFKADFFEELSHELNNFYENNHESGVDFKTAVEDNKWGSIGTTLPKSLQIVNLALISEEFRSVMSQITGFEDLEVTQAANDSGYSFFHVMRRNSFLGPHTDHTVDMGVQKDLYHVLNIILYIQRDWNTNWGGGTSIYRNSKSLATDIEYRPVIPPKK